MNKIITRSYMQQLPIEIIYEIQTYLLDQDYCRNRLISKKMNQASKFNDNNLKKRLLNRLLMGKNIRILDLIKILSEVDENKKIWGYNDVTDFFTRENKYPGAYVFSPIRRDYGPKILDFDEEYDSPRSVNSPTLKYSQ